MELASMECAGSGLLLCNAMLADTDLLWSCEWKDAHDLDGCLCRVFSSIATLKEGH